MRQFIQNFIAPIYHLEIIEDLGEGFQVAPKVYLSNNIECKKALLTDSLKAKIGDIEVSSLESCQAFFYSSGITKDEKKVEAMLNNYNVALLNFLYICEALLLKIWIIKDHSCCIDKGFIELFEIISSKKIISFFGSSNYLGSINTYANGKIEKTKYSIKELEKTIEIFSEFKFRSYDETFDLTNNVSIYNEQNRIGLALSFLSEIRPQHSLGIKISNFCSLFEAMFSTNSHEITHKLSERIACFLESKPEKRLELYKKIKSIYSIRSLIVHGSTINQKKHMKLEELSSLADDITRKLLTKILKNKHLVGFFVNSNNVELDDYLNLIIFGKKDITPI